MYTVFPRLNTGHLFLSSCFWMGIYLREAFNWGEALFIHCHVDRSCPLTHINMQMHTHGEHRELCKKINFKRQHCNRASCPQSKWTPSIQEVLYHLGPHQATWQLLILMPFCSSTAWSFKATMKHRCVFRAAISIKWTGQSHPIVAQLRPRSHSLDHAHRQLFEARHLF